MMKSIRTLVRQDREKYVIPRRVQDVIPIQKIWEDGIFLTGGRYAKTFRFTDINYQVASEPDKEKMFRGYSALINSLDCGATTKITIFNHKMSQINFEKSILMPMQWDGLDDYREEYNQMLLDKATNGNGIVQEKFLTVSVRKKDVDAARSFFARVEADLSAHFAALGSTCGPMNAVERLQILHRFYRRGEENEFSRLFLPSLKRWIFHLYASVTTFAWMLIGRNTRGMTDLWNSLKSLPVHTKD